MAKIKEKHPHWFKLKVERRQLIRQLPSENAVNVLLACFDYLETGTMPATLSAFEKIAISAFLPDLEEAWAKYAKRVECGGMGGAPKGNQNAKKSKQPYGTVCPHMVPYGTEVEEEKNLKILSSYSTGDLKIGDAALNGRPPVPFPIDPDAGEYIDREGML